MIKLLWRVLLLVLLGVAFAWLADRPERLEIKGIDGVATVGMSVAVAGGIVIIAIGLMIFIWGAVRRLWRSPTAAREFWRFRKHRKGYEALSKGIIAAGAGDAQAAARHAATAGNALSDEPLVNVLAAQAAQLKGDRDDVRRVFEEMAKSPDTEVFGLRGLFTEARNSGDLVAALRHAERALALNPRLPWASSAVLQVQTARKNWEAAALTLDQQARNGLAKKDDAAWKRAAMLTAEALAVEQDNPARALDLASRAVDLDPKLVPAAAIVSRHHIATGSTRRAMKVLRAAWSARPHPDLAQLIARADANDTAEAAYERVRDTVGQAEADVEHAVALASAAIAAQRHDVARQALSCHIDDNPQARVCALMAQIEEAAGDKGRVREWLARAITAPRDPLWMSDGVASPRWMPVSPVTGEIVPCAWKTPYDMGTSQIGFTPVAETVAPVSNIASALAAPASEPAKLAPPIADDPGVDTHSKGSD